MIREDKQGILLTDDTVYIKFNMLPLQFSISSEKYIKSILSEDHPALFEFIKNKYKGFTISTKQLVEEFTKKANSQDNFYANCLENISMTSVLPCIKLINAITQSQLNVNQQEIEIKNVFINMLKNGPLGTNILQYFEMLLYVEFRYSQEKFNMVYEQLRKAYQIIGILQEKE